MIKNYNVKPYHLGILRVSLEQNPEISFLMILCKHFAMAIAIDGNIIRTLPMAIAIIDGNIICGLLTDSRLRLSLRLAHVMSNPTDFCRHLKRHCHQNQIKKDMVIKIK